MNANQSDTDIPALLDSWIITLAAEGKSEATRDLYRDGVRSFLKYCDQYECEPELSRRLVNAWVASLTTSGLAPATARARQLAVRRFSAWLADEGDIETDQLATLRAPKLDTKVVHDLHDDELRALLKACQGEELRDRRDEAILRLMLETGVRAGEVVAMRLDDVDVRAGVAVVRRGKGRTEVPP